MSKAKYVNVKRTIQNILCDEDFKKVDDAFKPQPTEVEITVKPSTAKITTNGGTKQLNATTIPADAVVTWSSSDETKATVSEEGLVSAVADGSVIITGSITVEGETVTDTCSITITNQ